MKLKITYDYEGPNDTIIKTMPVNATMLNEVFFNEDFLSNIVRDSEMTKEVHDFFRKQYKDKYEPHWLCWDYEFVD